MTLAQQPEISTTGRTSLAPLWMRSGLRAIDVVAPTVAERWLQRLYFRPGKLRVKPDQRAILDAGLRFELDLEGLSVVGHQWGQGQRRIWLVHGWGGHLGQLTPFVEPLVQRGYRVIGFDWPGHGESAGDLSSLLLAHRALTQLERLVGAPDGVVAHSFGAAATTLALGRGLSAKRVVFHAPIAHLRPVIDRFVTALGMTPSMQQRFIRNAESWLKAPFADFEPLRFAPALTTPLLILHSRDDRDVALSEGETLGAQWPGAKVLIKDGLGHRRLLRDPVSIEQTVQFLGG